MKKIIVTLFTLISWPGAAFVVLFRPAGSAIDAVGNFFLGLKKKSDQ